LVARELTAPGRTAEPVDVFSVDRISVDAGPAFLSQLAVE
jgi:hypothetical protein